MKLNNTLDFLKIEKDGASICLDAGERHELFDYLLDGPYREMFTMRIESADQAENLPCEGGNQLLFRSKDKRERAALIFLAPESQEKVREISCSDPSPKAIWRKTEDDAIELYRERTSTIARTEGRNKDLCGKLIYYIATDDENKRIIIKPMQDGEIVLYGPDWAEQFTDTIRHYARTMWNTQR